MSDAVKSDDLAVYLNAACRAARAGGEVLQSWRGKFAAREKAPADMVTEADLASQVVVRDLLLGEFPDHGFLGEEDPTKNIPGEYRWVVDPLDGTTNYVHQLPCYCTSIALERNGETLVGAVYDPNRDLCYMAQRGGGAWVNDRPLRVSATTAMNEALVAASFPAKVRRDSPEIERFIDVLLQARAVRRMGSAALNLCELAAGHYDAYWAGDTKLWDVAAGLLIVAEAGGFVTSLDGGPYHNSSPRFIAAGTPELHAVLCGLLNPA